MIGGYTGSGDLTRYGQGLTDTSVAQLMSGGFFNITNPVSMLAKMAETLLTLPLEVLMLFAPMIPGLELLTSVPEIVEAIINFFSGLGPLLTSVFNEWVSGTFSVLATMVQQILEILNGLIVTPINELVQGVKDWFTAVQGTGAGVDDLVGGIVGGVVNGVGAFWNAVASLLGQGPAVIPAYTPENAAIAALQGQVNAQAGSNSGGDPMYDGFNTGPALSASWRHIEGAGNIITAGGYAYSHSAYECHMYDADRPDTDFWQVQASVAFNVGSNAGTARIIGGANTNLTDRYPAIEYGPGIASDEIRLVSLEGTPDSPANANLGRTVHGIYPIGFFVIKTGDVLALEVDEASGVYNVYRNPGPGVMPILTYDDSTANLIDRGASNRDFGGQWNLNNSAGAPGPGWDNFSCFNRAR